jgi:phosphonate transport system substrate-binding protein
MRHCTAAGRSYVFSTAPWGDPAKLKIMYRPLLDYIEEQTGVHFEIVIFPTYDDLVKEVSGGYVQFAAVSGANFLKLQAENAPMRYLSTSLRQYGEKKNDYYTGYIIVRKDSGIKNFSQLRGKKFAFVDVDSASGYKMPIAYMARQNLDPKTFFKKFFFMGDHDEVIKALKNRHVDGGATWEVSYDMNVKKYGDIFDIIYKSPPIPNDAWVVGNKVPKQLSDRILQVMLGINNITATKKGTYVLDPSLEITEVGFTKRSPKFYSDVKDYLLTQ